MGNFIAINLHPPAPLLVVSLTAAPLSLLFFSVSFGFIKLQTILALDKYNLYGVGNKALQFWAFVTRNPLLPRCNKLLLLVPVAARSKA
jgi:hypothetical protein